MILPSLRSTVAWLLCSLLTGPSALATVRYVDANSANPTPPYSTWATAATSIQHAVDAAVAGDEIVVTNGVYASGGRALASLPLMTNRVTVNKPVTVRSLNGPAFTTIQGYQVPGTTNGNGAIRCVYLTNGAVLSGFTLTNGATRRSGSHHQEQSGGGVWCAAASTLVINCTLTGNSAGFGGGAYYGTLNNCTLTGNSAQEDGGGAYYGTLNNCTLTGNSAGSGGGAYYGTLNNSVVYYNTANVSGPNYAESILNYSCTVPMPADGVGNITNEPALASASHLSPASPCRGQGSAAHATGLDIDGEAWLNPPSIGGDEYTAGAVTGGVGCGHQRCLDPGGGRV